MPSTDFGDAHHLAFATWYRLQYWLTWNCKHLANANKFEHIQVQEDVPMNPVVQIEGTWEEIVSRAPELTGRKVRVIVLPPDEVESPARDTRDSASAMLHRRPDPPFETGECGTPFDLPRPGVGARVSARTGGVRLPEPMADCPAE